MFYVKIPQRWLILEESTKKTRIWELDAFRGICIIGVIIVHAVYDMTVIFGADIKVPEFYYFIKDYGSVLFILLSGICVTLGRNSLKRGAVVLGFGLVITLVMAVLTHIDPYSFGNVYFGVLHLLGVCMLIFPLFKKLPLWASSLLAIVCVLLGFYFDTLRTENITPLVVLGIKNYGFFNVDYFPLFPNLGYFLIGSVMGRTLYKNKQSLLPRFPCENWLCRFFTLCGRHSLWIYLLHQPLVYAMLYLAFKVF